MERLQEREFPDRPSQLFRIIRIECDRPLEGLRTLLWGESPWAEPLGRELTQAGTQVRYGQEAVETEDQFDLIVLFEELSADTLGSLACAGALVVDAVRQKNVEWTVYDPALHYRRIRVVSIAGF